MPFSLAAINSLPKPIRDSLYRNLIPKELEETLSSKLYPSSLKLEVKGKFPVDENLALIEVKVPFEQRDPVFLCQVSLDETFKSVSLDFILINDVTQMRFNIDVDEKGQDTFLGLRSRNIKEEVKAMEAGLAPGMIRPGLKLLRRFVSCLESFASILGIDSITLEPLFYHTAILFERYGFTYLKGLKTMLEINREFEPGGKLFQALDGSSPFRRQGMHLTVRGRSWAIHDGILEDALGKIWEPPKMYKRVSKHHGINTFPNQVY